MGRPKMYSNEKERKDAIRKSKTKYMLKKQWYCKYCDRSYSLAAKWSHIYTKKHQENLLRDKPTISKGDKPVVSKKDKSAMTKEEEDRLIKILQSKTGPTNPDELIKEILFSKEGITTPKKINLNECEECGEEKRNAPEEMVCVKCGDLTQKFVPELDLNSWKKKKSVHLRDKWFSKRLIGVIKNKYHDLLTSDFRKVVHELVKNKYIKKNVSRYNFYIIRLAARRRIALLEPLKDMAPGKTKEKFEDHLFNIYISLGWNSKKDPYFSEWKSRKR